ncbi:MAG: thioredoxin [Candidatus Thorarchaeota archaeon]|nr:thioredoxin [Candidatus Thorarchaeota archaeon]
MRFAQPKGYTMSDDELAEIRRRKMQAMMRQAAAPKVEEPMANGQVNLLTDGTFWQVISKTSTAMVDFFGEWCGPCRALAPTFVELAREWAGKVFFGKIDIDRNPVTTAQFGIQSVPMVVAFKAGRPVGSLPGLRSFGEYDAIVEQLRSGRLSERSDLI